MEVIKRTGYEWCFDANIRLLKLNQWSTDLNDYEYSYYKEKITAEEFYKRLAKCDVKPNSQPRKTDMYLEYRMYGLVPYNLSPIQQGIQFGHAVVRYGRTVEGIKPFNKIYNKWADFDETFIILNGGTTNLKTEKLGTLNKHLLSLKEANIQVQDFYEPDLGDQLTAICFLVDERVFNKTLYPDFVPESFPWSRKKPSEKEVSILEEKNKKNYDLWVNKIGGKENAFLRDFLKSFKLA